MSESQAELLRQLKLDRSAIATSKRPWGSLAIIAVLIAAALAWWWQAKSKAPVASNSQPAAATAPSTSVARPYAAAGASGNSVLDASGYVVARRAATVSAKVTGKVVDVQIEEGQKVTEGMVLARLDDTNAQAQLALTQAQADQVRAQLTEIEVSLRNAKRDAARLRDLVAKSLVAQATLDAAESNSEQLSARLASAHRSAVVAQAQVQLSQKNLDDTVIRAPFTGVVTVKNAQPGEMISPLSGGGSSFTRSGIGTLVDMNSLEIEVDVSESFIGKVQPNQPVQARLNAYPDAILPASVIAIVPTADRAKATVKVRVAFTRNAQGQIDARVLPDMGVRVAFLASTEPSAPLTGVLVPESAVYTDAQGAYVLLDQAGRSTRTPVTTGPAVGAERLITQGLSAGQTVRLQLATENPA